ncbi:unnamed protein product [Peronospora farinosa]|uniref:Myb-like domain-containing protein n=1 Tax=Peronospora farinosa TaxID=134698 RepID=A0AAV0SQ20_9STRA|nr:unnamed protein product [Peronospora farinosa]
MPPRGRQKDPNGEGSVSEKRIRQRFGQNEDYLLILQVKRDTPYNARHGAIGDTWDNVAERLNKHPDFHMRPIKGTTAKTRFDTLLHRHRNWIKSENFEHSKEIKTPFQKIMTDLVKTIDIRPKGKANFNEKDDFNENEEKTKTTTMNIRANGKKRQRSDSLETESEPPVRRDISMLPRTIDTADQMPISSDASFPDAQVTADVTEPMDESSVPQSPIDGDVVTVQQAMAELFKMQQAFATRPYQANVIELEKINEARVREEEEKTKQRGLELQIEMQRTRRRQLELDFEKEERKKDREEQAKLIASLFERLEPKRH